MDYDKSNRIDLHIHSTYSDGTLTPAKILAMARDLNLGAIAITDHDTIDGSKEALRTGIPSNLKFLTGVEISALPPRLFSFPGSFHILGYLIRFDDPILNSTLNKLQQARKTRNPKIIKQLNMLGIDLSLREVIDESGQCQLGRPHIARTMVKKGFVKSINDAFDKYLGKGRPAYIDKFRVDCSKAIEIILGAGGVPVLAHPVLLEIKDDRIFEQLLVTLIEMGLQGLEVYYPEHSAKHIAFYEKLAKQYNLLMTGGTDFHGSIKPDIKMGTGRGDFFVPCSLYNDLINCCCGQ